MEKKPEVEKELERLRQKIDAIDREMVAQLADRQAVVEDIVALKKRHNMPVYHPAREENLISDRRTRGQAAGLDPEYVEELFRCIMRQSRKEQGVRMADTGVRSGSSVLIVGGEGEMGAYFHHWFERAGYRVDVLGKDDWDRVAALCENRELVLVSVPIDVTCRVIAELAPHLPSDCLLADITSVKAEPLAAMLRHHDGPVVGLHPLFGPTTSTLDKQIVVATHGRDADRCRWLLDQMAAWGAIW